MLEHGIPRYDETGRIFTFRAATYKDGQDVAATGRVVPDAGGNHPIMKYDYDFRRFRHIPGTVLLYIARYRASGISACRKLCAGRDRKSRGLCHSGPYTY